MRANGSSSVATQDKRVVKTKRSIKAAYLSLVEERGIDGITVNELCERANVNRGTFYNHYCDRDAVLNELEKEFFDGLKSFEKQLAHVTLAQVAMCNMAKRPLPLLVSLFDYLREHGVFLHAVLSDGGDPGFGFALRDNLCARLIKSILHERYRRSKDPFVGYYIAFFASAYLGVITKWIKTGMKEDSQQMALVVMRLLFIKPGESIKL